MNTRANYLLPILNLSKYRVGVELRTAMIGGVSSPPYFHLITGASDIKPGAAAARVSALSSRL